MVTGRISLRSPEYSPISSSVSDVRAISSRFHCRPATGLVGGISGVAFASAVAAHAPPPHQRPPGAPGENHDAGSPSPQALDGLLLVLPQLPARLVELDRVRL